MCFADGQVVVFASVIASLWVGDPKTKAGSNRSVQVARVTSEKTVVDAKAMIDADPNHIFINCSGRIGEVIINIR